MTKNYYILHKEEIARKRKTYYAAHKKEKAEYKKAYYASHRQETLKSCKAYRDTNKKKIALAKKDYRTANKSQIAMQLRKWHLGQKYGISEVEYNNLLLNQGGVCKICGNPPKAKKLAVDHSHLTGKIRGLLCRHCNMLLGQIEKNITLINKIFRYSGLKNEEGKV